MKPYLIIFYLLLLVAIGAVADAYNDDGVKTFGHIMEAAEVAGLLSAAFVFKLEPRKWLPFFLAYAFFRIVGFDYMYNITRGLPLFYVGVSNAWDNVIVKIPPTGLMFIRAVFLAVAVSLPIKYLRD